jgi:two-component system chemotaxis response regulator CheY
MSKTILVVDDSKAMRLIVRRTLRQAGFGDYEVEEASNGREALERVAQSIPSLVLSDWNMPEMTGIELLSELNARKVAVRFGFVTTEGTADMRATATAAGALFLIAKPFTPEQFEAALRPILS